MIMDKEAQTSRLSNVSPALKLVVSLFCMINCIVADNIITSALTLALMTVIICAAGGTRFSKLVRSMRMPIFAAAVSCVVLMFEKESDDVLISFAGICITVSGLNTAVKVFMRCMGAVSAMYFLAFTTPAYKVFAVMMRTPMPNFIVETAELVYRYIFILLDAYKKIHVAQAARGGYNTLKAGYRSTALVCGAVFGRSLDIAKRSAIALESRGYTGEIKPLGKGYKTDAYHYIMFAAVCALLFLSGVIF